MACTMALASATGAMAQTSQSGLVNVNVEDVVVQVPIAIAANICDVTVAACSLPISRTDRRLVTRSPQVAPPSLRARAAAPHDRTG